MTLTLLLQLTEEEQLYAAKTPQPAVEAVQEAVPADDAPALKIMVEQVDAQA